MKKKIKFKVKINQSKIPNKMHLDAQIRYPARTQEDKSKFNRTNIKRAVEKEIKSNF